MKRLAPLAIALLVAVAFSACKRVIDLFPDGGPLDNTPTDGPIDTPYWYDDGGFRGPLDAGGLDTGAGSG